MMKDLTLLSLVVGLAACNGSDPSPTGPMMPPSGRFATETVLSLPAFMTTIVFTAADRFLLTEKGGFGGVREASVRVVEQGSLVPEPIITFRNVQTRSESGLLGLALDPDYETNRLVYALYNHEPSRSRRVVRFRDDRSGQVDADAQVLVANIPVDACGNHQGGGLGFGTDGRLFVSSGDNGCDACTAQDGSIPAGKLLRFTRDGEIPPDNPFPGTPFYAVGLRNSFKFTFHPRTGLIYATENGPGGNDEVNRILAGRNYGWPFFQCAISFEPRCPSPRPENTPPLACYSEPIAPTGIVIYDGDRYPSDFRGNLFFGDFNTGTVHRLVLSEGGDTVMSREDRFLTGLGRIVDLVVSPDGFLHVLSETTVERVVFVPD